MTLIPSAVLQDDLSISSIQFVVELDADRAKHLRRVEPSALLIALNAGMNPEDVNWDSEIGPRFLFELHTESEGVAAVFERARLVRDRLIQFLGERAGITAAPSADLRAAKSKSAVAEYDEFVAWMHSLVKMLDPEIAGSADAGDARAREMRAEMCWSFGEAYTFLRLQGHSDEDSRSFVLSHAAQIAAGK